MEPLCMSEANPSYWNDWMVNRFEEVCKITLDPRKFIGLESLFSLLSFRLLLAAGKRNRRETILAAGNIRHYLDVAQTVVPNMHAVVQSPETFGRYRRSDDAFWMHMLMPTHRTDGRAWTAFEPDSFHVFCTECRKSTVMAEEILHNQRVRCIKCHVSDHKRVCGCKLWSPIELHLEAL